MKAKWFLNRCRVSADLANVAADSGGSQGQGSAGADPLDDLFPRVELDGLFKGTTILADAKMMPGRQRKKLSKLCKHYSTREVTSDSSLTWVFTLLLSLHYPTNPLEGEIGQILKARVTDTNKAVQVLALDIVARIAMGMGKPFDKHARIFVQPVCTVLSDQKANIRSAAVQTLNAIAEACDGVDPMIPGVTTALETTNPLQKATLIQWAVDWFKSHDSQMPLDLRPWAPLLVSSLDDRNSDVRKGAQALLPVLIQYSSFDFVMQQTGALSQRPVPVPYLSFKLHVRLYRKPHLRRQKRLHLRRKWPFQILPLAHLLHRLIFQCQMQSLLL